MVYENRAGFYVQCPIGRGVADADWSTHENFSVKHAGKACAAGTINARAAVANPREAIRSVTTQAEHTTLPANVSRTYNPVITTTISNDAVTIRALPAHACPVSSAINSGARVGIAGRAEVSAGCLSEPGDTRSVRIVNGFTVHAYDCA